MNVQLDITGVTGIRIIRGIVEAFMPRALARHRDIRCKQSIDTISKALIDNYHPEHLIALRHVLEIYDFLQTKLRDCNIEIERVLQEFYAARPASSTHCPVRRSAGRNEPRFDVRAPLYKMLGADPSQIHGLGPHGPTTRGRVPHRHAQVADGEALHLLADACAGQ